MRILYIILFFTLRYTLRVFYPRQKTVNSPKELFGRTIYVSNHPASFMDPLVVASMRLPVVFFMTRSDVFKPLLKPILWACHMLPIYRQHDGGDTKEKNNKSFKQASRVLKGGRNLLIFGEGFTDDVFIRRLKPIKKGAAKIGFQTLEELNWKKKIYVAAVGNNYSRPNLMRSDILVSTSDKFCLNDYREMYEENPSKAITQVTRRVEKLMQEQITHIEDKNNSDFHEQMMEITRKGMSPVSFDPSLRLEDRWRYSQKLAYWLNEQNLETNKEVKQLKEDTENYFRLLKRMKLEDKYVFWKMTSTGSRLKELLLLFVLAPFAFLGMIHQGPWYLLVKRFVEKSFRRKVFWGSVKLVMGKILMGLLNIPYIFIFYYFVFPSWWIAILYYLATGIFGLAAYMWFRNFTRFKTKGVVKNTDLSKIIEKRKDLNECIIKLTGL